MVVLVIILLVVVIVILRHFLDNTTCITLQVPHYLYKGKQTNCITLLVHTCLTLLVQHVFLKSGE